MVVFIQVIVHTQEKDLYLEFKGKRDLNTYLGLFNDEIVGYEIVGERAY